MASLHRRPSLCARTETRRLPDTLSLGKKSKRMDHRAPTGSVYTKALLALTFAQPSKSPHPRHLSLSRPRARPVRIAGKHPRRRPLRQGEPLLVPGLPRTLASSSQPLIHHPPANDTEQQFWEVRISFYGPEGQAQGWASLSRQGHQRAIIHGYPVQRGNDKPDWSPSI